MASPGGPTRPGQLAEEWASEAEDSTIEPLPCGGERGRVDLVLANQPLAHACRHDSDSSAPIPLPNSSSVVDIIARACPCQDGRTTGGWGNRNDGERYWRASLRRCRGDGGTDGAVPSSVEQADQSHRYRSKPGDVRESIRSRGFRWTFSSAPYRRANAKASSSFNTLVAVARLSAVMPSRAMT